MVLEPAGAILIGMVLGAICMTIGVAIGNAI